MPHRSCTQVPQPQPTPTGEIFGLGGYFEPFSAAKLQARYGTRGEYVDRVRRSARELVESRFILQEDYWDYVIEAWYQPLW